MKKYVLLTAFLLFFAFLTACGAKEDIEEITYRGVAPGTEDLTVITDRTEYYDLTVEAEELFDSDLWEKYPQDMAAEHATAGSVSFHPIGTQFYQGEPVQLWADVSSGKSDVYLCRKGQSPELLLQNVPSSYTVSTDTSVGSVGYQWYMDREENFYCCHAVYSSAGGKHMAQGVIVKILSSGEILYTSTLDPGIDIKDFCQTEDGRIYLLLQDEPKSTRFLAELDPATGKILPDSRIEIPYESTVYLGISGDSPAVTGYTYADFFGNKIMKVDMADGSLSPILYFTGTSYGWHNNLILQDLQVLENGQIELLWTDPDRLNCLWERLRMEKVKKIPIVVRGTYNEDWLADRIAMFNMQNSTYHVILETCGMNNDCADFSRLTSVQTGAGKGPDILWASLDLDFAGMLEKGILEELNPYMEASGVREEDYFPLTFDTWRQDEQIYGVSYRINVWGQQIDEELLGNRETPGIEALMDALLAQEGDGIYRSGDDSGAVLKLFLQGTDSLWGMVDWEKGVCDFNTPLFGKLLEAAKRYGDDSRKSFASDVMEEIDFYGFFNFVGRTEQEEKGKVTSGVLFDDGCYAASYPWYSLAINANSPHKDGAWEFLSFLIGEESQGKDFQKSIPPLHKEVFETWLQAMINEYAMIHEENGNRRTPALYGTDISEQKQAEYRNALEEARALPARTAPILTIILEEAADYFNGSKSAEEVSSVVNNRVQLFLDERSSGESYR